MVIKCVTFNSQTQNGNHLFCWINIPFSLYCFHCVLKLHYIAIAIVFVLKRKRFWRKATQTYVTIHTSIALSDWNSTYSRWLWLRLYVQIIPVLTIELNKNLLWIYDYENKMKLNFFVKITGILRENRTQNRNSKWFFKL